MDQKEARAYYNYLMTLNLRHEEAFGPLALTLINENDLRELGLLPGPDTGFVPYNTPIFSVYPVLAQKNLTWKSIEDMRKSNKP